MTRIIIWLVVTVVAANLVYATPVPNGGEDTAAVNLQLQSSLVSLPNELLTGFILPQLPGRDLNNFAAAAKVPQLLAQDVKGRHGGELFYNLRQRLDLPVIQGSPTLVGLRTLLEGAQIEYRGMAVSFLMYLRYKNLNSFARQEVLEINYPDLFRKYPFRSLTVPPYVHRWFDTEYSILDISIYRVKHGISNLGLKSDMGHIVDVIVAFFEMLDSPDLLTNFQTVAAPISPEQQGNQGMGSTNQASMTPGQWLSKEFRAFMHRFWLDVIGGGNIEQLRYYLGNMLAFSVIPHTIARVLECGRYAVALELAKRIGQIPGFTKVASAYPRHAPNIFEFIMVYATLRRLNEYQSLVRDAHQT
ncbi:hypothetical protein H4R35_005690, partial [Dimargaris xerosporica]